MRANDWLQTSCKLRGKDDVEKLTELKLKTKYSQNKISLSNSQENTEV